MGPSGIVKAVDISADGGPCLRDTGVGPRYTSSYLMVRHRRSTKTLSRQAPFPSMLILISFLRSSRPVKAMLVNWEP